MNRFYLQPKGKEISSYIVGEDLRELLKTIKIKHKTNCSSKNCTSICEINFKLLCRMRSLLKLARAFYLSRNY